MNEMIFLHLSELFLQRIIKLIKLNFIHSKTNVQHFLYRHIQLVVVIADQMGEQIR